MRNLLFALLLHAAIASTAPVRGQHLRIYACAIGNTNPDSAMGGSSNGSGLYASEDTGKTWKHLGWNNLKTYSMDEVRSSNGNILYVATGLGVLRSTDAGEHWKQLTDWRISEVTDIAVDQKHPEIIYIATAHGPWRSKDGGRTWNELMNGLPVPFTSCVVIDSVKAGHVLLASEEGLYSIWGDTLWTPVQCFWETFDEFPNPRLRFQPAYIHSSAPHWNDVERCRSIVQLSARDWIAASEDAGYLESFDSGRSFESTSWGSGSNWCVAREGAQALRGDRVGAMEPANGMFFKRVGSSRNVHSCLLVGGRKLLGSLGNGIETDDGTAMLPGRQIWTLKSYLVTP